MNTAARTPVKAAWTDFGGVLTPPVQQTMAAFCRKTGLQAQPLMRAIALVTATYGTDDMMLPLDTPLVTEEVWLASVSEALRRSAGVDVRMTTLADTWFQDRETNVAWLRQLHRMRELGIFVGMLSNMPPAWDAHWRRMVPPEGVFDDVVMSFEVGTRKPDLPMYRLAESRAGVAPEECLLIDDLPKNCDGAVAAGWQVIHFTDTETAIKELDALLGDHPSGTGE
jgi:putative hydrolase of the HAD superfamily